MQRVRFEYMYSNVGEHSLLIRNLCQCNPTYSARLQIYEVALNSHEIVRHSVEGRSGPEQLEADSAGNRRLRPGNIELRKFLARFLEAASRVMGVHNPTEGIRIPSRSVDPDSPRP